MPQEVRQALAYLFANRQRMRYRRFRQAGYPIGSGTVESACKAVVAIARKLLVSVWHVLTKGEKDKHAESQRVAQSLMRFVYRTGVRRLPKGMTALEYTRQQLDRLEIGQELTHLVWGNKRFKLPPSSLAPPQR